MIDQTETYKGWVQLIPTTLNSEISTFMFSLSEPKSYTISSMSNSDMILPSRFKNAKLLVRVDRNGKVEVKNVNDTDAIESITLNDKKLNQNEKSEIRENMKLKIGTHIFTFRRADSLSTSQMKVLIGNLQCSICLRFLENAKSLSCQHVFCEQCLSGLVKANNTRYSHNALGEDLRIITCPVCRQSLPPRALIEARPQKTLSDLSKLFQDVMDSRPMCAMCSNQRWIVHGCDYIFCETCSKVLCPLCALDFHRDHVLKSNFLSMLQTSREFAKEIAPVKEEWQKILEQVDESKENARKANAWIEGMKSNLKTMEATLNAMITPSTNAYQNVQKLNGIQFDDKIEAQRAEALKNLETEVNKVTEKMNPMIEEINAKVNLLTAALNEMKNVSSNEADLESVAVSFVAGSLFSS